MLANAVHVAIHHHGQGKESEKDYINEIYKTGCEIAMSCSPVHCQISTGGASCSSDLQTEPDGFSYWPKKRPENSTTPSLVPSTSCSDLSAKAKAWPLRPLTPWACPLTPSVKRSKRPSAHLVPPRPVRHPSRPGPRRFSNSHSARRSASDTPTSAPSTCSWVWCASRTALPPRSSKVSVPIRPASVTKSCR